MSPNARDRDSKAEKSPSAKKPTGTPDEQKNFYKGVVATAQKRKLPIYLISFLTGNQIRIVPGEAPGFVPGNWLLPDAKVTMEDGFYAKMINRGILMDDMAPDHRRFEDPNSNPSLGELYEEAFHSWYNALAGGGVSEWADRFKTQIAKETQYRSPVPGRGAALAEEALTNVINGWIRAKEENRRIPTYEEALRDPNWQEWLVPGHTGRREDYANEPRAKIPLSKELYEMVIAFLNDPKPWRKPGEI